MNAFNTRTLFIAALDRIPGLKPGEKVKLYHHLKTLEALVRLNRFELEWIIGRRIRSGRLTRGFSFKKCIAEAKQGLTILLRFNSSGLISLLDPEYPPLLREIYDPPFVLYFRGGFPASYSGSVAIVGTRRPTAEAQRHSFRLALELTLNHVPVVSGLALGIDTSAHEGAVASHGRTVAVLASGVDRIHPGCNRALALRILENGGALVSEYPPGTAPRPYQYPARNRIISGLCRKTVVVQAPKKSGALHTADFALDQGRDLYVCRETWDGRVGQGTASLNEQGACVVDGADDLYHGLGFAPEPHHLVSRIKEEHEPEDVREVVHFMKEELLGHVYRYKGGLYVAL